MKNRLLSNLREHLSLRLGIIIVLIITMAFALIFGFLFYRCKRYIKRVAIERATQSLENTVVRINGIMEETELVTNYKAQAIPRQLYADSLLAFTRQAMERNKMMQGFTVALQPDILSGQGERFTAYSYRTTTDSIVSVFKNDYNYFDDPWYKTPVERMTGCWLEPYRYAVPGIDPTPVWYFSYTTLLLDVEGHLVGVGCADLSLKWLSQAVSSVKPFPHSSAIMVGRDGRYLVHPDTTKIIRESIFSDPDPKARRDIETLGRAMTAGRSGVTETIVDGQDAFIFYTPLKRTGWSIAIVCPASDIYARYNRLFAFVMVIISVGLLLLLLVCYQVIRRNIQPLKQLDLQAQRIADGVFNEPLSPSPRHDSIGRLTNSFILMKQSLAKSVADIQRVNDELQQHNDELTEAYQIKLDANRKKADFIHYMYHEIRTPLNIISGFAQVLTASRHSLESDEVEDIMARMQESANDIRRLTRQLEETANQQQEKS